MAISPADFYAYSRATGVPVPESPEERAQMAPEVLEFRRNQLKAPESQESRGFDPLSVGIGVGLALAGGVGAALAGRRLMRGPAKSATAGVRQVNLAEMATEAAPVRRVVAETTPPPSKEPDVVQQIIEKYRPEYEQTKRLETGRATQQEMRRQAAQVQGIERQIDDVLTEIRSSGTEGFNPRSYLESTGSIAPAETLTDTQKIQQPLIADQKFNAVESAEDQQTGRVMQRLQQNEDYDITQVSLLEDIAETQRQEMMAQAQPSQMIGYADDAPITQVASQLPDGLPVDQIEQTRSLSSQELADIAKTEMMARRQTLIDRGLRPGTTRFERALAEGWASKAGLQPGTEEFRQNISLPTTIRKAVEAASIEEVPESERIPGLTGRPSEHTLINIGPEAQIKSTAAGTAIRGAAPSLQEVLPKVEERQLFGTGDPLVPNVPMEMGQDIPGALRVTGAMPSDVPTSAQSKQEIKYSILNRAPLPEIPGGSAGMGIYGQEAGYVPGAMSKKTGEYSTAASRKPTDVPKWIAKQEATPYSGVSTEGLTKALEKSTKSGTVAIQSEIERRQRNVESVALSETLRDLQLRGRPGQAEKFVASLNETLTPEQRANQMARQALIRPITRSASSSYVQKKPTAAQAALARYVKTVGNPYEL